MKKAVIRDLNKEQEMVRFNPFQLGFAVYTMLFMLCSKRPYLNFSICLPIFIVMYVIAMLLSVAVLRYNQKYETRKANKTICYLFTACNVLMGIYRLMMF